MYEEIIKVAVVFLLTMLKFIFGPTLGYASGFGLFQSILVTVSGMMTSVFLFTFLGNILRERFLKRFFSKKKRFTKRNRQFVTIWRKYGLSGVAFLTPLIFTPIGGTVLLTSFGSPRRKIIISMMISAVFWSVAFCTLIYTFGPKVLPDFMM